MVTHEEAEQRVNVGFVIHLIVYAAVVGGLSYWSFTRDPEKVWPMWMAAGWGVGIVAHGVAAFLLPEQRERMIQRTAARMERHRAKRGD